MSIIKLSATIIAISLFLIACNTDQPRETANVQPVVSSGALTSGMFDANDYWAKDNLDLQRVGDLLERSNSPQEFEGYLNSSDGINNLDLNGDGYVDYISVDEYQDRDDNSRGLSIFSRFGPDLVQEIAQVILYRDEPRYPGARIALYGNDQIYGDNQYYETNWLDRSLGIAKLLFGSRDTYYRSPITITNILKVIVPIKWSRRRITERVLSSCIRARCSLTRQIQSGSPGSRSSRRTTGYILDR
ncbi:MAG: hypothetical protein KA746_03615 [Pyrinomonadaceae bacterium]|nr:hypothetical protein [Pyrinomonadaceae bacterium]